jgi:hypothetical protein
MKRSACVDVFPDASSAAAALADFGRSFAPPSSVRTAAEVVDYSTEGAWIRQLARKFVGVAGIYRRWAEENVPRMIKSSRYVINQEQFDLLVRRTGMDLLRTWRDRSADKRARLSLGAAFRIVDGLFMSINEAEGCRSSLIQAFLHVPLEGSTLKPLRLCVDELLDRDFAIEIPTVVPAGFVATEEQYVLLQEAIFALAARAGVPPILYGYFCADFNLS